MEAALYPSDVIAGLALTATTKDLTIWISTTGNDTTGNGTVGSPFATWVRAFRDIPLFIEHRVRIKALSGTYTSFPAHLRHHIGRDGILSMEGAEAPTQAAGPFTLDSVTEVGHGTIKAGLDLEVIGAGWAADQWYGKFIRFTSGTADKTVHAVYASGGDIISTTTQISYGVAPGDTFIVVDPSVKIECDRAPVFSIRGDGTPGRALSSWIMANLEFEADLALMPPPLPWRPFSINEEVMGIFGLVRFVGLNVVVSILSQKGGIINLQHLEQHSPALPLLEDNTLIVWGAADSAAGSVQITAGPTPPVASACWYDVGGCDATERGVGISNVVCRNGVYIDTPRGELSNCGLGFIDVDHRSTFTLNYSRVDSIGLNKHTLRVDDGSMCSVYESWIDGSDLSGIIVEELSGLDIAYVGGILLNIADYGILLTILARVSVGASVDLEGVQGKVRFNQTDTTVAYPLAKNGHTDGMGSWIVK